MSAEISTTNTTKIKCGACSFDNEPTAQFCQECGHALHESCSGCSKPVLLSQAFCGKCGENLKIVLQKKRDKFSAAMASALSQAKEMRFDEAANTLKRLKDNKDYRFEDLAQQAHQALEKILSVSERMESNVEQAIADAKHAIIENDHEQIVQRLGALPVKALPDEVRKALERSQTILQERSEFRKRCEVALQNKDYQALGPILEQLIDLDPDNATYPKLAKKVAEKLIAMATKYREKQRFDRSLETLESVPRHLQGKHSAKLRSEIEHILWLRGQFDGEPFDTPTLGRLAVRLAKDEPLEENQKRVQAISQNLKTGKRSPVNGFPYRHTPNHARLGGRCELLRFPSKLPLTQHDQLKSWGGRLNEAMGLAIQGVGLAKLDYNLLPAKGFLKSLRKRKDKLAWGIDVGTSAIKGVCIERSEEEVKIVDGFIYEFDEPTCRLTSVAHAKSLLEEACSSILEQHSIGETPVWTNLSAGEVIGRFSLLPPVADKQAKELIEREQQQRIPLELDLLEVRHWLAPFDTETQRGRACTTVAAKKSAVDSVVGPLSDAGFNVVGVQADQIALINLIYHEFESELVPETNEENAESDLPTDEKRFPTIAVVHCGAQTLTTLLVSEVAHWFWTVEQGGEDLTRLLARQLKKTMAESEQLKCNPHLLETPAADFPTIESRLDEWQARSEKLFSEGLNLDPSFQVTDCYASGGGMLTHQWMKRVLVKH